MSDECELPEPNYEHYDFWAQAESFSGLCNLSARFLAGEIQYYPGWSSSGVYEESLPYRDVLARINRKGFLTYMSQPGDLPLDAERRNGKRPFITGFVNTALGEELHRSLASSGYIVLFYAALEPMLSRFYPNGYARIAVRLDDGAVTFSVGDDRYEALTKFERCLPTCGSAMEQLGCSSFLVVAGDWGQNGLFDLIEAMLPSDD
jgi:hypothetical protein